MKKLLKMNLKDAIILDDQQLKHMLGGSGVVGPIDCSVICPDGLEVAIVNCYGDCITSTAGIICSGVTAVSTRTCRSGAKPIVR